MVGLEEAVEARVCQRQVIYLEMVVKEGVVMVIQLLMV